MPSFDYERFLRARRIDCTPTGARQVAIPCPFCGPDHPNHRLSINLDGQGWRCWRAPHLYYGRSPVALVQRLVGCSAEEAREIVGAREPARAAPPAAELGAKLARLRGQSAPTRPGALEFPREFRPLVPGDPASEPFVAYLEERGYRPREIAWLAETYGLGWAARGRFAWRLIFPVRGRRGELLTWTGRGIGRDPQPKYRQPKDRDVVCPAPRTLFGLDRLWSAPDPRVLVVCEGPLDAARVSVSGAALGVWGTCLFGLSMSPAQRDLVTALADRFPRVAVLLDAGAERERRRVARQLAPLRVLIPRLPAGVKDPGDLTAAQATALCMGLLA